MMQEIIDIVWDKLVSWGKTIVAMFPNFILALVVLVAFYFLGRLAKQLMTKTLPRVFHNRELIRIFGKISNIIVLTIGVMIALNILDLDQTVTSVLAGAGIIGLALAFAFQDLAANFVSGFAMASKRPFEIGNIVEVNDVQGVVAAINLRTTEINTFEGNTVIIPNKDIYQNNIVNYQKTRKRRVDLEVGVSYGDDLRKAKKVAIESIEDMPYLLEHEDITVFYKEFGGSSVNFEIRFWVPYGEQQQYLEGRDEAIIRIKEAFDREGLTIPFPIRTLDFGVVGGEKLNEVLKVDPDDIKQAS